MDKAEREKRITKALELWAEFSEVNEKLDEGKISMRSIMKHMAPENEDDKVRVIAAMILGLRNMRNTSADFIRLGSLMRRFCDILEPMYEAEE